jgi:cytochrome c-type biogenesis protein CcmH
MITFWIVAAVMLIAAILCAVIPVMQRDDIGKSPKARRLNIVLYQQELADANRDRRAGVLSKDQHASLRRDIEQRVFAETTRAHAPMRASTQSTAKRAATSAVLIALFPAAACALYLKLGEPVALNLDDSVGALHDTNSGSAEMMVSRLAFRLRAHPPDPRDANAWATLARSYAVLERPTDAAAAYARAVSLEPRDAQLRADFADALASANEGRLDGRASEEIAAALAIDSTNPKALALAASAAFEARQLAQAIGYWHRLNATLNADSPIAIQARKNIEETLTMSAVTVTLQVADGAHAAADAVVVVTARAKNAANTVLAQRRLLANGLPATIVLDDSFALNAADTLSAYAQVSVEARMVSISSPGDLSAKADVTGADKRHATLVMTASPVSPSP